MPKCRLRMPTSRRYGRRCSPSATINTCGGALPNTPTTIFSSATARAPETCASRWRNRCEVERGWQIRERLFNVDLGRIHFRRTIDPVGDGLRPEDEDH